MMILETKNKKINLVFTTRKLVTICNTLKGKNFEELYFNAINQADLDSLSKIVYNFAEDDAGVHAFKTFDEVFEFIDDYKEEQNKTYQDIFAELSGAINDEGFFKQKLTKKELQERISNPLSGIDMENVIKTSAEKAITKMAEEEIFKGYLG